MNAEQKAAVERLDRTKVASLKRMSGLQSVTHLIDIQTVLSLITELEADGKRLDWMSIRGNFDRIKNKGPGFYYVDMGGGVSLIKTTLRQAIDAAMKGAV